MSSQAAVLAAVPPHASFVFLNVSAGAEPAAAIRQLASRAHPDHLLVGVGCTLLAAVGASVPGMRPIPALIAAGVSMPRTPADIVLRISGADRGEVLHRERDVLAGLGAFELVDRVEGFVFGESRDLTGYEDGTENPSPDAAPGVALQQGRGPGLHGSSVVAIQRWVHDLDAFAAMSREQQDHAIGRELDSNDELADAPDSAHVKRTAQEDFEPEAFLWRRSMPWRDHRGAGLVFMSFSATLDPFEAQCRRMMGEDDGIVDALFSFTRPVTGGAWWCPPVHVGRLDLRACD